MAKEKKVLTPEEVESRRLKKNATLKEWRGKNKEYVSSYMKNWFSLKKGEEVEKITFKKFNEAKVEVK